MKFGLKVHHNDLSDILYMGPEAMEFAIFPDDLDGSWADEVKFGGPIAVHMPVISGDGSLVDLASPDDGKRADAIRILKKTIDIGKKLKAGSIICHPGGIREKPVPVDAAPLLGSMRALKAYTPASMELLLENMPTIYWYQGKLYSSCLFKHGKEIGDILNALGIGLCMDLCHAKLYCNASGEGFISYVRTLRPFIRHIHIADARGISGEGLQIGDGEIDFEALLPLLKGLDVTAVPEIIGGHRERGAGFRLAADRLVKLGYFDGPGRR
jgi:N-acetylneuraminate synthase